MIKNIAFLLLFVVLQSCSRAQTFNKAKMDSFFVALSTHDQSMGSIAISVNGALVYQNAIGYSQINDQIKSRATVKTEYRVGSISKMFTGVMIFQLIEEGKLKLETPLATYFPQLPNAAKITIAEMLSHRSGIYDLTTDPIYSSYSGSPKSKAQMLSIFASQKPDFEPDTRAAYSNTNFVLLGYIIEKLTGKTYARELKERITSKIGLANTYYGSKTDPAKNEANSYLYAGQWVLAPETDMSIPGGGGSVVSTATDLVKFIDALFAGKLISPASLELMKTQRDHFGMAMFIIPFNDEKGYGHDGGIDGFINRLIYFPDDKLAIAYVSNGVRYSTNDVVAGALSIYFNRPFVIPEFKESQKVMLTSAELDKYLGKYSSTQMPIKFTITKNNTMLFARAAGQPAVPMEAKGDNKFFYAITGATFQFDPWKNSLSLTFGGKVYPYSKNN